MQTQNNSGKIFIGHGRSSVWRDLKDFLQDRLHLDWDEFNRESTAGLATKERLETMLENASFAFLIMTAEDEHANETLHARENVIHEIGLFQGRLGFRKAIILFEEGCQEFSNIFGLTQIRFPKGTIEAKFEEIRRVLEREEIINRPIPDKEKSEIYQTEKLFPRENLEKREIQQSKSTETKPPQKTVVNKPQPKILEPQKNNFPNFSPNNLAIFFRAGRPFVETDEESRILSIRIENNTGGEVIKLKVRTRVIEESRSFGSKSIYLTSVSPDFTMLGFAINNTNHRMLEIARQSLSDPQNVSITLPCIAPPKSAKYFDSIEFTLWILGQLFVPSTPAMQPSINLEKRFALYIDEGDLLQLKEI